MGNDTLRERRSVHYNRSGNVNSRDKIWNSFWWRRNQTRDVESAGWRRNSLVDASVASCVEVWQNSPRLANRCDYSDIQERRSQAMHNLQRDITPQFARKSISQMPWKEMLRNSGIKTGRWPVQFSSGSQNHRPNLHCEANLREILGVWQRSLCMLCRSWKS